MLLFNEYKLLSTYEEDNFIQDNLEYVQSFMRQKYKKVNYQHIDHDDTHELYGACHRASVFWFFLKGGWESDWQLTSKNLGEEGNHTFCVNPVTKEIADLTKGQFKYLNNTDWYTTGVKRTSTVTGKTFDGTNAKVRDGKKYDNPVPSVLAIGLGMKWKEKTGSAEGLEYWIKEYENYIKLSGKESKI